MAYGKCTDPGATNAAKFYRTATQTNPPDCRLFDAELQRWTSPAAGCHQL